MPDSVFITKLSKFLPNRPVGNDDMEKYLGMVDNIPSRARRIVLRNNGIKTRYYAIDESGNFTHNNAEIAAEAVKGLFDSSFNLKDIELLSVGTTSPDQIVPSHASMIHGVLGGNPFESVAFTGACCSGSHALKYGYLSVLSGDKKNAVCVGSEQLSSWMHARNFQTEAHSMSHLEENPILAFEKDFLRWMLSDGAGAFLLEPRPGSGISLKIEWIENTSYANEVDACMYAGASKNESGKLTPWRFMEPGELLEESILTLKQDVKLLNENIIQYGVNFFLDIRKKRGLKETEFDYFLPHLSSEFFKNKLVDGLKQNDINIPLEKWFTNLSYVGNVGAASIYIMLEELYHSGKIEKGQKILLMIPESARFSYTYVLLTVC